jgi:acyl carrier protein
MDQAEIIAILTGLFREILDNPDIQLNPGDKENDIPGFDSAKKVHLLIAVEQHFGIRLHSREIDMLRLIDDWTVIIQRHCDAAK